MKKQRPKKFSKTDSAKKRKKVSATEEFRSKSRFYRGEDIKNPFDAEIDNVTAESMPDGEEKWALSLVGHDLGIVLNQGNGIQLAKDFGDDMMMWPGNHIHVFTERVRNPSTGEMGPGIRVSGIVDDTDEDIDDADLEEDDDID